MAIDLTRGLDAPTAAALDTGQIIAVPLLYLNFVNSAFQKYYAGAGQDIVLSSSTIMPAATYVGVGGISSVSVVEESIDLKAPKITVSMNGIDSTYISLVLAEQYYGGDATLSLVLLDSNYSILSGAEPIILFKGFMSVLKIDMDAGKADISIELESILADWERPRVGLYNTGTQRNIDDTDRGFDNVSDAVSKELIWRG